MEIEQSFVYSLGVNKDGSLRNRHSRPFDINRYSRFKYGDGRVAAEYALAIAEDLVASPTIHSQLKSGKAVITSSAFKVVATAAHAIAHELHAYLFRQGYPVSYATIYRSQLSDGDYAKKSLDERQAAMAQNGIRVKPEEFNHRHVFTVDDIRITGSHEDSVRTLFGNTATPTSLHFIYAVEVKHEDALADPTIEDRINHAWMNSPERLVHLMSQPYFKLNARTCKYVLGLTPSNVVALLNHLSDARINELYAAIQGDGYHLMPAYQETFQAFAGYWQQKAHRRREVGSKLYACPLPVAVLG